MLVLNALKIRWKSCWRNTLYLKCIKWFSLALAPHPLLSHFISVPMLFCMRFGCENVSNYIWLEICHTTRSFLKWQWAKKSNNSYNNMYTNAFLCHLTNHIEMSASCTEMRMGWGVWVSDSDKLVPIFSMKNYLIRNKRVPIKQLTVIYLEQIIQWNKLSND